MAKFELTNSHSLTPDQPANEAVRVIFTVLLADLRKNIPGTLEGRDPEHLHDLRVASRRTRSLLTQLKKVLPMVDTRFFSKEFGWLGKLTGTCRDLDVWLLDRAEQRSCQTAEEISVLAPLDDRIANRRAQAQTDVRQGLTSIRFETLLKDWEAFLRHPATTDEQPAKALRGVKDVADARILKAYHRLVRRSYDLNVNSPANEIHRLRIDGKKLRYLLECFRSLYREGTIEAPVEELKKLQDALGGFNDMAVQQCYLAEIRGELEHEVITDTVHAIDQLATTLAYRQIEFRRSVFERLEAFVGQSAQIEFPALINGRA